MTVRLSIDFLDEEKMMEWFEDAHSAGLFGTIDEPGFPEAPLPAINPQRPRPDVGVRHIDSLDAKRVNMGSTFIVSNTGDGGRYERNLHEED